MSDPQMLIIGGKRGRPPRAGTRANSRIEFCVTADERRYLEQMAESQGYSSLAAAVRDACNSFVSDYGGRTIFTPSGPVKKR